MFNVLVILIVIASILMIGIVLIQKIKRRRPRIQFRKFQPNHGSTQNKQFCGKSNMDACHCHLRSKHLVGFLRRQ